MIFVMFRYTGKLLLTTNLASRLNEVTNDGLALAQLGHREGTQLVQLHHSWHRWEDEAGIQPLASRGNCLHNLQNRCR